MDCVKIIKKGRGQLKDYCVKNNIKSLVLGVSGGIDSAVVAAFSRPVCDELQIPLIGRSLPCFSNKEDEIRRANRVGHYYCSNFKELFIDEFYNTSKHFIHDFENLKPNKVRNGNIMARLRMIYLYHLASDSQGMVLSTDNLTEYYLGFWTLHGDVGDFGLIQGLWKTEVYELAEYLDKAEINKWYTGILDDCIKATPTDGLGITNSDLEQLGANSYKEVDEIIKTYLCSSPDFYIWDQNIQYENRIEPYMKFSEYRDTILNHPVVKRIENTEFKRNNPLDVTYSI